MVTEKGRRANYNFTEKVVHCQASQAKTDEGYKKELEKAIEFFEIAAKEASYFNPAKFCLPFYRSFHTIIFKKQEAREEVNQYLEEAKATIEDSERPCTSKAVTRCKVDGNKI